ncbi:hypothetical protein Aph01nite_49900 [Acrocarpospora phusangensis]|uniref:Uncharacterized protein n=1 Tax=Acrocarpospora phusangensis TaxID=1070424 RepID=A0A919QHT2_9ACTN|nr:hypothetical protein Aph01nite_49900 [Acrocarpospora phusangensis]
MTDTWARSKSKPPTTAAVAGVATVTPIAPSSAVNDNKTGNSGKRLAITSLSKGGPKRNQWPYAQAIDRPCGRR